VGGGGKKNFSVKAGAKVVNKDIFVTVLRLLKEIAVKVNDCLQIFEGVGVLYSVHILTARIYFSGSSVAFGGVISVEIL